MVQSVLNDKIVFAEKRGLFEEDKDMSSALYEIDVLNMPVAVAIGTMRTDKKNIVYYPVYIVADDGKGSPTIKSQIGLYEVLTIHSLTVLDENNNINLSKMDDILLYSFVTEAFLKKINSNPSNFADIIEKDSSPIVSSAASLEAAYEKAIPVNKKSVKQEKTGLFALKVKETKETKQIKEKLKDGVFVHKKNAKKPLFLEEETESSADEIMEQHRDGEKDPWIQTYMKNHHYAIEEVESNGDCLFAVIRDAYLQNSMTTTVAKLRAVVANALTDEIFNHQLELYEMYSGEKKRLENEMQSLKKEIEDPILRANIKAEKSKEKRKAMLEEANQKVKTFNEKIKNYEYAKENLKEYHHMEKIKTIDELRNYIMTSNYWADAWSIFVLEQHLKMKMIIFNEQNFKDGDTENVLQCGYNMENNTSGFSPSFYIMATYSGDHYRLITYNGKGLLVFSEIPYHAKILIVKKCMEKNAGIYNAIPDFRDFKSRLHVDEGDDDEGTTGGGTDLYDSDATLTYHGKASKRLPGKRNDETIPDSMEYANLAAIEHWRRKLDDSWEQDNLIRLDNKKWKSVEHYVLGAQYKSGFPDVYLKFALDSGSDISQSLAVAISAVSNTGEGFVLVDGTKMICTIDNGYDEEKHREQAVERKFVDNADFTLLLKSTHRAKLQRFKSGERPVEDKYLMKLRKQL